MDHPVQEPTIPSPARLGGAVLGAISGATASIRRSKPLHPRGALLAASVYRYGSFVRIGVPWVDEAGSDEAVVRVSRATGVPPPLPDVQGLALRVGSPADPADLLFASTGSGLLGRFVLTPRRTVTSGPLTTLLPQRAPTAPVLLAVRPFDRDRPLPAEPERLVEAVAVRPIVLELCRSGVAGPWEPFGELVLNGPAEQAVDPLVRFDPLRNTLPGLDNYRWVVDLREPAYAGARANWPLPTDEPAAPGAPAEERPLMGAGLSSLGHPADD